MSYMEQVPNKNVPLRPLTKGMIRNISPQLLPIGSFYNAEGVVMTENGPMRRDGFKPTNNATLPEAAGIILDGFNFISNGVKMTLIMTEKGLYRYSDREGFITIDDECFNVDRNFNIDYTLAPITTGNAALFADGYGYIKQYNGLTEEVTDFTTEFTNPYSLEFFNNYLYIGGPDDTHPNRLVWSQLGNVESFPSANYFDFLEEQEPLVRLKGLGNLLIAYFPKAIYFGRPTNRVDLPYSFTRVEAGKIGLIGRKAVTSWNDGHYFVGADDVYFLSAANALERIGTPIIKEMLKNCSFKEGIYVSVDPQNDCVVIGIPESDNNIDVLWYYNYKTGGWSKNPMSCSAIMAFGIFTERFWGDSTMELDGTTIDFWDDADTGAGETDFESEGWTSWKKLESSLSGVDLHIAVDNQIYQADNLEELDFSSQPIDVVLESGDLDLDLPDTEKTFNRLSLKVDRIMEQPIRFALYTNYRRGRLDTWEYKGDLVVLVGEDEGKVNFRSTGSTFRFRLVSDSQAEQYVINEIIIRGRPRGLEVQG
jgi:hypothetical protein